MSSSAELGTHLPPLRIDAGSRAWALATAGLALLPLLLQLPLMLALSTATTAVLVTGLSWKKPLPMLLRLLLSLIVLALVFSQMGYRFGRDTGCALLAATIAIKPSETSTLRDARSLIGFCLFAPFAAFLLDQGPLTMALGLLALLSALVSLQRLADVEASALSDTASPFRKLAAVGKLLAIGLPLALSVFWLFPRLGSPLWGVPERAIGKPGLSDSMSPGEWLDMMSDDNPALRVQFFGARPSLRQMYWRGPVLWDFDGRSWTRPGDPRGSRGPVASQVESQKRVWNYQIEFEPTDRHQLVALDLPRSAPAGSWLSADYGLYADRALTSLTRWRLQSSPPVRFDNELSPYVRQRALALPAGYNPRTLALGAQWRREAGGNDGAIVQRAMDWIRRDFGYTLETPFPGRDGVDEFLFDQKKGFCQHFSSSFVVLMRAAGIPARVVTGFVGGVRNPVGDYWVVRNQDAHAWAEVWLPQRGWVRVDPTAAVAPERIYDTIEDRASAGDGALAQLASLGDIGDWMRRGWNDLVLGFDANRQQRLLRPFGVDNLDPSRLGLLFGLFALVALGWMAWLLARGEREKDPLLRAWHRMDARYRRRGLGRELHEPALDWAQRAGASGSDAARDLISLSRRFAAARYAAAIKDPTLINDLRRHRP